MSQAVQLNMEVFQRIKFLMEYDVMKTSSENILVEQPRVRGASTSTSQSPDSQGKLGNTFDPISGQAKVLASRDPAVLKANQQRYGTIDVPRTDVSRMYSQPSKEVKEMRLDELTQKVRDIMTDWKTMTVETFLTITGVGIPVVIGVNGLWFTLETAQVLKGTPDWLNLIFSLLAATTAGLGSATLRPLYSEVAQSLGTKGRGSMKYVLDKIYERSNKLGLWQKLKPIFEKISRAGGTFADLAGKTWKWLKDNVLWIFDGVIWAGKVTINGLKTVISSIFNTMDTWMSTIGKKAGINPQVAQKLGSATRWSTGIGGLGYGLQPQTNQPRFDEFTKAPYVYKPGTFAGD